MFLTLIAEKVRPGRFALVTQTEDVYAAWEIQITDVYATEYNNARAANCTRVRAEQIQALVPGAVHRGSAWKAARDSGLPAGLGWRWR